MEEDWVEAGLDGVRRGAAARSARNKHASLRGLSSQRISSSISGEHCSASRQARRDAQAGGRAGRRAACLAVEDADKVGEVVEHLRTKVGRGG